MRIFPSATLAVTAFSASLFIFCILAASAAAAGVPKTAGFSTLGKRNPGGKPLRGRTTASANGPSPSDADMVSANRNLARRIGTVQAWVAQLTESGGAEWLAEWELCLSESVSLKLPGSICGWSCPLQLFLFP
jgi:hypothetical protein